jgi:hypothetical protein
MALEKKYSPVDFVNKICVGMRIVPREIFLGIEKDTE